MDGKVTVSVKSLVLTALAIGAIVVAYLIGTARGDDDDGVSPAGVVGNSQGAAEVVRSVRMVGKGQATAVPDEMSFGLSVTAKRLELSDALADASATMKKVLAELKQYGVTDKDVQTTGLSMEPEYTYPNSGPPILTGYRVTQDARVKVTDLGQGGKAISAAVTTGGNGVRVNAIRLDVGDPDKVISEARDAAVADAKAKAEQYAAATGGKLGSVMTVREVSAPNRVTPQPVYAQALTRDSADLAAVPIKAGESSLTVRVEVVWAFE